MPGPRTARPLSMIVAASENDAIGLEGDLPWRLPGDLKRFRKLTMGHHLIMGRRTLESIKRLLPGRTTVVATRQPDYSFPGAVVVHDVDALLQAVAGDSEPFVVGGAEIYQWLMPWVGRLYLTRVHATIDGDTFLPPIDWREWQLMRAERVEAGDDNPLAVSYEDYERIAN